MTDTYSRRSFLKRSALIVAALHEPLLNWEPATADPVYLASVHLQRLRLRANNLKEMAGYYQDVLGLPVERADADSLTVRAGTSLLEFVPDPDYPRPYYHFAFTIPENQLESALAWVEQRTPVVPVNPRGDKIMHFRNWNAHSCYFADPAGNILEFIAHHDLKNGKTGDFKIENIERISEIGIVVPDVDAFRAETRERLGLEAYRGGGTTFAPLGDIGGVLIVVRKDRIWLGSHKTPAEVFPTEVRLETDHEPGLFDVADLPYDIYHQSR